VSTVIELDRAGVVLQGQHILRDVSWTVVAHEHTVLLGPNGAGKTTLLRLVAGLRHATSGTVDVLGERIGRTDVRALRRCIGIVSDALDDLVDRRSPARRLVAAGRLAMTTAFGARLTPEDLDAADTALERLNVAHLADRRGLTLSEGEWKRVLLARALVGEPDLLLLDEPCNGLDLAQREHFLTDLDRVLTAPDGPTCVLITHHLEQVPTSVSSALLLRGGEVTAAGPIADSITSATVSATFDVEVEVVTTRGRLTAVPARRVAVQGDGCLHSRRGTS
jgi:iron complex transport system ATP-binding protein